MLVRLKTHNPSKGAGMSNFNVLALVEHLNNFVRATPKDIEFPLVSIFGHQHRPSLPHFRHSNMSVHLHDHMHLASAFLSKHCTHRIKSTFRSMHVNIHGRSSMRVRSHSGKINGKWGVPPSSISNGHSQRLLDVRLFN